MTTFLVTMVIDTDTIEHARVVLGERLGYDEEYDDANGNTFNYSVNTLGDLRPEGGPERWAVFNTLAPTWKSEAYDTDEKASWLCRSLNSELGAGGRYHVRHLVNGEWRRE